MWQVNCIEDEENGFNCDNMQGVPSTLYMHPFSHEEKNYFALWKDQTRHDICVPEGTSDMSPSFVFTIGNDSSGVNRYDMDYTSTSNLEESLDNIASELDSNSIYSGMKDIIFDAGIKDSWKPGQCAYQYTDDRCKYALENYETTCDGEACEKSITNYSFAQFNLIQEYAGTVASETIDCIWAPNKTEEDPEIVCPTSLPYPGTISNWEYNTTDYKWRYKNFTRYSGTNSSGNKVDLMIACKEIWYEQVRFETARGESKTAALTALNSNDKCSNVTDASNPFYGMKNVEREAIHDYLLKLGLAGQKHYSQFNTLCTGLAQPSSWDFSSCEDSDPSIQNEFLVCRSEIFSTILKDRLGLKVDTSGSTPKKMVIDSSLSSNQTEYYAQFFCPTSATTFYTNSQTAWSSANDDFNNHGSSQGWDWYGFFYGVATSYTVNSQTIKTYPLRMQELRTTLDSSCQTEFSNHTFAEQVEITQSYLLANPYSFWSYTHPLMTTGDWNLYSAALTLCKMNSTQAGYLANGLPKSCLPESTLDTYDSNGQAVRSLRCNGSGGGECYDGEIFKGSVQDRINVVEVENGVNDAFNFLSTRKDSWFQKYGNNQRPGWCREASAVNFDGAFTDENHFNGLYKVGYNKMCGIIAGKIVDGEEPKVSDSDTILLKNFVNFELIRCTESDCSQTVDDIVTEE